MNIPTQLQEVDDLISEHTKPPLTVRLRNKLSVAIEQAQAHATAVERQEKTLATQIETIAQLAATNGHLITENAKLVAEIAALKAEAASCEVKPEDRTMCH